MRSRLLVVDDDQDLRDTLAEQLGLYDEFQVPTAETAAPPSTRRRATGSTSPSSTWACPTWTAARLSG